MNTDEFFKSLVEDEKKNDETRAKQQSTKPEEFLTLKIGGSYDFVLLPTKMVEYDEVSFKSRLDDSYQYLGLSPQSVSLGDAAIKKNPISDRLWKSWNAVKDSTDKAVQSEALQLVPKTRKLANIYLISDSLDKENDGKNKVLSFGAGFNKKTKEPAGNIWKSLYPALFGDLRESFGPKLFELGPDGITIRLSVKAKMMGDKKIPEYTVTMLPRKKQIATDKEAKEICAKAYDLSKYLPELKKFTELEEILTKHWDCNAPTSAEDSLDSALESTEASAEEDDLNFGD